MNDIDTNDSGWGPPKVSPRIHAEDAEEWRLAREDARAFALAQTPPLNRTDMARRMGISSATFHEWFSGTYKGNLQKFTKQVFAGLRAIREGDANAIKILEPPFLMLPTTKRVQDALVFAQVSPAIVLITLGPGMGKTEAAKNFAETRPHAFRVVMRPSTKRPQMMLREIAASLDIPTTNATYMSRFIGNKLKRNGRNTLLMVDEAQHLTEESVNELRYLLDEFQCGIALIGNEDVHARFGGTRPREGYGQLHRRIGMRIRQMRPTARDVDEYVSAWDIADESANKLLRAIGSKPGALGQIAGTIKLASIAAMGQGREITAEDIKQAWVNRSSEELH